MWLVRRFTIAQVSLPNTNKNSDIFTDEPIFTSCLYHAGHKLTLPFRIHLMRFIWRALHLEFLYALFVVLFGFTFESMSSWLSGRVLVFFFYFSSQDAAFYIYLFHHNCSCVMLLMKLFHRGDVQLCWSFIYLGDGVQELLLLLVWLQCTRRVIFFICV